ncbi:hypothetical protein ABE527_14690 [Brucella sp. TWI432]
MTIQPSSSLEQTVDIDHAAKLTTDTRQANWRRANPKKYAAHIAVQKALGSKQIEKQACEVCGNPNVDAHHDDYSQPSAVRWLCRQHHTRLHSGGEDMFSGGLE